MPSRDMVVEDEVAVLFYLPAIQTLQANLFPAEMFSLPAENPPCAVTLKRLDLTCFRSNTDVMRNMLSVTPNLESFRYGHCPDINIFPHESLKLDLAKLGHALGQVRAKLKALTLWINSWHSKPPNSNDLGFSDTGLPHYDITNSPFSLRKFDQLEFLYIPLVILFGHECLFAVVAPSFISH